MFIIDGIPILEDEMLIVETLKNELHNRGIDKLAVVKKTHGNIQVCCPIHKNGQERKPSCGINLDGTNGTEPGTAHCFTCGYVASFKEFVSDCFGYNDKGEYGKKWILENFVSAEISKRSNFKLNLNRNCKKSVQYITEEELDKYRYIHPYMYQRKLTDEIIEKFDVGYDKDTQCLTFPVWDLKGNCVFVARRSVKTKFFNYPMDANKPVYALNFIKGNLQQLVVCESIINALTCWTWGVPAVALIGTGSYEQYPILQNCSCRKLVLALDSDEAGDKGRARIIKNVKGKIIKQLYIPKGKDENGNDVDRDVNDLDKDEFMYLLNHQY